MDTEKRVALKYRVRIVELNNSHIQKYTLKDSNYGSTDVVQRHGYL